MSSADFQHVAVLGAGSWGTALAWLAAQKCRRVTLWGRDAALAEEVAAGHFVEQLIGRMLVHGKTTLG